MWYPRFVVSTLMRVYQSCQSVHIEAPEISQSFLLQVLTGKVVLETRSFYIRYVHGNPIKMGIVPKHLRRWRDTWYTLRSLATTI